MSKHFKLLILSLISSLFVIIHSSFQWGRDNWGITEWLINYSGGFVRRGLPGSILYYISELINIKSNILAIIISSIVFFSVSYWFVKIAKEKFSYMIIFSPILLGAPIFGNFLIRKDLLGIAFLMGCILIEKNIISLNFKNLIVNILSISSIFSHEAFFFYAIPLLIFYRASNMKIDLYHASLHYSPSLFSFIIIIIFKGNSNIAFAINQSLSGLWIEINPKDCCIETPSAAIQALEWSTSQGISLSLKVLSEFSFGIYSPAAWLASMYVCSVFLIRMLVVSNSSLNIKIREQSKLFIIIIFQFLMIFPLFILGWDFGRWIFLWMISSVIFYLLNIDLFFYFSKPIEGIVVKILNNLYLPLSIKEWHLLFFGLPGCCWSIQNYIISTPLGSILKLVFEFLKNII
jgi:hypothetical protein